MVSIWFPRTFNIGGRYTNSYDSLGDETMKIMKFVIFGIMAMFLALTVAGLTIESPEEAIYVTDEVPVDLPLIITSNITFDNISYQINNGSLMLACENCSGVNDTLNLSEGNYTLLVQGALGNDTTEQIVSFTLEVNETLDNETPDNDTNVTDFSLIIINPVNTTYNSEDVALDILSDSILEQISYILDLDNETIVCENCSSYSGTLTISEGSHTLTVRGILEAVEKQAVVSFLVEVPEVNDTPDNETPDNDTSPDNETEEPRFSLGFNKLPKALMNDGITDEELAAIINENKLNPGIINRLIKTGKLGELSQQAIIDTQFNPPGIFKKLLGLIGFTHKSHSELIYENYNLSEMVEQNLLGRDDLPEDYVNEIKNNLQKRLEKRILIQADKAAKEQEKATQQASQQEQKQERKQIKLVYKAGKQNGQTSTGSITAAGKVKAKGNSASSTSGSNSGKSSGKSTSGKSGWGNSGGSKSSGGKSSGGKSSGKGNK